MPRVGCLLLIAALLCAPAVHANPLPFADLATAGSEPRQLGQGRMRWFGLALYDATLWVGADHRRAGDPDDWRWDRPFALDLRYARDFKGPKLAEASVDEIRRLGLADGAKLDAWRAHMVAAFPDVKKGERITGVFRPAVGAEFFHQDRSTGLVRDPEFARAFFSIWLDPRTREPKLRAALLGAR